MKQLLAQLEVISDILAEDSEAALKEIEAFRARESNLKHKFVRAKADLLALIVASVFNRFDKQYIDDVALLRYFEQGEYYEEAAQLLLAKARHYFMNSHLAEGEALLHYLRDGYLDKVSLRSEIVYLTRVAFVHGRRHQHDEVARISLLALDKLKTYEPKAAWYYSIYTIFCTNIAESYHSNQDYEKALPYLQQCIGIAETQKIPLYNKYNVYSYVAYYHDYKAEHLKAAEWFERIITMLHNQPGHEYYEIHSRLNAARQYAMLCRALPVSEVPLRNRYIQKQQDLLLPLNNRITDEDGNYLSWLMALAELEYQQGEYEKAVGHLQKSLDMYTAREHHKGILDCNKLLHQVYYAWGTQEGSAGKLQHAYLYLKSASDMVAAQARQTNLEKIEAIQNKLQLQEQGAREQLMQQQMDSLNKEVRLSAINLQEKIKLLDELRTFAESYKKKRADKKEFIDAVIQKITAIKITEQDKTLLQQKMEESNSALFKLLTEMYPLLTPHEVRTCGLIKTGLTNKELSKLYGIGERGYEQLRHRIKKKMNLGRNDNLIKHLMNLSGAQAG